MLTIRSNVSATLAKNDYTRAANKLTNSFEKLSSGVRITRASDDVAGLGVGTNLTAHIASLQQVARNAVDGMSMLQTMDGAIGVGQELVARLRQLTMQAVSDGLTAAEKGLVHTETDRVLEEFGRLSAVTEYVGRKPLNGSTGSFDVQIGLRGDAQDFISVNGHDMTLGTLGLSGFQPTDKSDLTMLDGVIDRLNAMRSDVGATYNRLQSVQETITNGIQSISSSLARVMDTDVAEETAKVSTNQVLMQAGASVMSNTYQFSKVALSILEK